MSGAFIVVPFSVGIKRANPHHSLDKLAGEVAQSKLCVTELAQYRRADLLAPNQAVGHPPAMSSNRVYARDGLDRSRASRRLSLVGSIPRQRAFSLPNPSGGFLNNRHEFRSIAAEEVFRVASLSAGQALPRSGEREFEVGRTGRRPPQPDGRRHGAYSDHMNWVGRLPLNVGFLNSSFTFGVVHTSSQN